MLNCFINKDQAWLESELSDCQDELAAGRTVIQSGAGDVTTQERVEVNIWKRVEQLLFALATLDAAGQITPAGKYPWAQCKRVTRTRVIVFPWYDCYIS